MALKLYMYRFYLGVKIGLSPHTQMNFTQCEFKELDYSVSDNKRSEKICTYRNLPVCYIVFCIGWYKK
jgi:hypothetical protein